MYKQLSVFILAGLIILSFAGFQLDNIQENEFCRILKIMVSASQENFEPIKKDRKTGAIELYYTSNVNLPTSTDTKIILKGDSWYLSCKLQERSDLPLLNKNLSQLTGIIKGCMKNWRLSSDQVGKSQIITFKDPVDKDCGAKIQLSLTENPAKAGYYKIMLMVHPN